MNYKLLKDKDVLIGIERSDGWHIPVNPDNTDYQAYLKWVEEGNTPLPADEVTK